MAIEEYREFILEVVEGEKAEGPPSHCEFQRYSLSPCLFPVRSPQEIGFSMSRPKRVNVPHVRTPISPFP